MLARGEDHRSLALQVTRVQEVHNIVLSSDPSLFASIQEVEFRSLRGVAGGQAQSSLPSLAHPLLFQAVNEGDSPLFSTVTFWWLIFPPQTHKMFPWKVDMHEWNLS